MDTEGLTLQKVESSSEHTVTLLARDKLAGDPVRLQVDVVARATQAASPYVARQVGPSRVNAKGRPRGPARGA